MLLLKATAPQTLRSYIKIASAYVLRYYCSNRCYTLIPFEQGRMVYGLPSEHFGAGRNQVPQR